MKNPLLAGAVACSLVSSAWAESPPVSTFDKIAQTEAASLIAQTVQNVTKICPYTVTINNQGHESGMSTALTVNTFCLGQQWPESEGGLKAYQEGVNNAVSLLQSEVLRQKILSDLARIPLLTDCFALTIKHDLERTRLEAFSLFRCTGEPSAPKVEGFTL